MSVGARLGTSQTQDFVLLGALALGFYVVYQVVKGIKTTVGAAGAAVGAVGHGVSTAYTTVTAALGSGLYKVFGPDDAKALGSMTYFMVNFPDGSRHAVPGNTVTSTGLFTWTGYPANSEPNVVLQLMKDDQGRWYATSETPMAMTPAQLQPISLDESTYDMPVINFGRGRW